MPLLAKTQSFFRNLFGSRKVEAELNDEIDTYLDMAAEEKVRAGVPANEARRLARVELGGAEQVKERIRDQRVGVWMYSVFNDLSYASRQLRKNPGFSFVAVLTLALGIGFTTAIFSVVYGVLLRPLPFHQPDRLMSVLEINSKNGFSRLADPNFDDIRDQNRSFASIAKYTQVTSSVSGGSQPTRSQVTYVTPDFLKVFATQPVIGRDFIAADNAKGAAPTALVSYAYWKQYLSSNRDLSQLHLKIDNDIYSIVGVLPAGFVFPTHSNIWIPADLTGENPSRTSHNFSAVARLRDGVSAEQAKSDVSVIGHRIHDSASEQGPYLLKDATVIPLQESIVAKARTPLYMLLAAVGFLLLVACANVANLLLAQVSARQQELAIRSALGASRIRIIRQFLTESLLLSLLGGIFGVLGAFAGVRALVALAPASLPRLNDVSVNLPVMAFTLLICTLVAVGLGAFTAIRGTTEHVREGLAEGGRGQATSSSTRRLGNAIVVAQVAITLVLVLAAGLFGRSLLKVLEVDPGFRVDKIITMDVSLPYVEGAAGRSGRTAFYTNLLERLRRIPGVREVGATSGLPMTGGHPDGMFALMKQDEVPDSPQKLGAFFQQKERTGVADFSAVTDGYLRSLGVPPIRGRIFNESDGPDSQHVAVITESLAQTRWPNQDPIGQTIQFGNMDGDTRLLTIVGVVADTHEYGLDVPPRPTVYVNLLQRPTSAISVTLLTDADTASVTSAARQVLQELNPELPLEFKTFSEVFSASLGSRRFNVILIGFFGITALILATVGVFGVMAYSVSRRTREIGVRVALGAASFDVLKMIIMQGMRTVLLGVVIGIAGSLVLTRTIESLLFGVSATDPLTFGTVPLLLGVTALVACYLPARRASNVNPMVALRYE